MVAKKEPHAQIASLTRDHSSVDLTSFGQAQNAFAVALYKQLTQRPGNVFFSPFSIRTALGMAFAGARGETAVQMKEALRFFSSDEALHTSFATIIRRLNAAGGSEYEMAVANSLWSQVGTAIQTQFLELVTNYYDGGLNLVDFQHNAEDARVHINQWVEKKTSGSKRKRNKGFGKLNPVDVLDDTTRLVLVNAVYFKGLWVLQFNKHSTCDESFYLESRNKVQVPLMYQRAEVRYFEADDFQAVDLDYHGDDLSMLVLLQKRKDGLRNLETRLSANMFHDSVQKMQEREVRLFAPRFKMTWGTVDLTDQLRTLGMPLPFRPLQADFSGINGHEPPDEESLFINAVYHKAFVDVNEEGTEAAAATAVVLDVRVGGFVPRPVFRADHPFLFAMRDRTSGVVLFLGRMTDPTR